MYFLTIIFWFYKLVIIIYSVNVPFIISMYVNIQNGGRTRKYYKAKLP